MSQQASPTTITGEFVTQLGETYYKIGNYDDMPPFFMTVVSSADHWLFVASTGGITAGRINRDHALFPYYTVDRITENADNTGSKTILRVQRNNRITTWEPFIPRHYSPHLLERNLYKNIVGSSVIFEEINHDLGLSFRYAWRASETYGIIKTAWLTNLSDHPVEVTITDGLQNILPAHIAAATQNEFSVLLDAYKRAELDAATGLGIFSLSSRLTDLAEPSEALRANTVWQVGLGPTSYLLSSQQLDSLRTGHTATPETGVRGERGAYFVNKTLTLAGQAERSWHLVAEVNQDGAAVADLSTHLRKNDPTRYQAVERDITATSNKLKRIVATADGLQVSGDPLSTAHHFANVLFNTMRGGIFVNQYQIEKVDFLSYVHTHDHNLTEKHATFFENLTTTFTVQALKKQADAQDDPNLVRLCYTYLPLTFSRRHGDPSRPWNRFSIDLKNPDGSPKLSYQGNWRDIFQNWEALLYAYPEFVEGIIAVFLSATTPDGYNPYRISLDGIDWEVPEPDNPWANIGYWSDHQIIYLQKLLELSDQFFPGRLQALLQRPIFAYANVPYRIKGYSDIVQDAYDTITFDVAAAELIDKRVRAHGTDGKLLMNADGQIIHTNLVEKLLNLLLAKLVNFVPGGGIWMNTQRPEWNDANNALVGKGLSVVTTAYLRRYVAFLQTLLADAPDEISLTRELYGLLTSINQTLETHAPAFDVMTDTQRRTVMDALGTAGSTYRQACYTDGYTGNTEQVTSQEISVFLALVQQALDHTLHLNRRDDALYHAYNTLHLGDGTATIGYLQPMLEGQVAILSSGLLQPQEVLDLLWQLRHSDLYRADQHTYILYPDRELPGFLEKNTFSASRVNGLNLVQTLIDRNDPRLIVKDTNGNCHFSGDIRNARDLQATLDELATQPGLAAQVKAASAELHTLFEQTFNHDQFTGRSGSFFAYEGLGSIYWHMVSKLLLAVQENIYMAATTNSDLVPQLIEAYYDVRMGLGFNKSPDVYGAFPLDPYSHTPRNKGAKQPGMTGMVKEEILTRLGELGLRVQDGKLTFDPVLLRADEWLGAPATLVYWDTANEQRKIEVPNNAFALTLCNVPVIVQQATQDAFVVQLTDGSHQTIPGRHLDLDTSQSIFGYADQVQQIVIHHNFTAS